MFCFICCVICFFSCYFIVVTVVIYLCKNRSTNGSIYTVYVDWLLDMYCAGRRSSWWVRSSKDSRPVARTCLLCLTELNWPTADSVNAVCCPLVKPSVYQLASTTATTTTDVYTAFLWKLNGFHLPVCTELMYMLKLYSQWFVNTNYSIQTVHYGEMENINVRCMLFKNMIPNRCYMSLVFIISQRVIKVRKDASESCTTYFT